MRTCFVSRRFFPAISGMSIYAINLLRQLVARGHDVTMISQYRGDDFGKGVYGGGPPPGVAGVKVIGLEQLGEQLANDTAADFERDIDTIVATIEREHAAAPFDLLHAQYGYPTGWAALLAGQRLGLPVVVSIQGGDGHWVGSCCETHRAAMVRVLDHADAVLIGGESFAREVHDRLGTPMDRFTLIPGAVDTKRFTPGTLGDGNTVRILYHGRVDRRKGVLDFIAACDRLTGDWRATISGIGPDLDAAKALTAKRDLGERIVFTGYADYADVPQIYREHHIFASPTYAEGFSNTILEAMASGLAIVSCHAVGVSDCLRDAENGLLIEPGDVEAQAACLQRLIDDEGERHRLADAALTECRAVYSWDVVGGMIAGIYGQLRGSGGPTSFDPVLPADPDCRFRAEPHLL
ncbi:glycosyltransferase family 4 protein [Aurantiacibacter spongiae]|uniref:Glycosyltransferase family 1 protein n=1 Tax=Aurantiacibacter spongiae TaxID=2488860 RepID=A0A3N5CX11_9SPHN|nr:glycosyltransferase family 4 protein [Aurantiacibacter spongiae]RPF71189.1 glycosyltransferase family 1 protein [Aurantiacibacter spongiae]